MDAARIRRAGRRLDVLELLAVAVAQRNLHESELFDVARNGGLRRLITLLFEQMRKLFLRPDRPRRNKRQNGSLSLCFHYFVTPSEVEGQRKIITQNPSGL